MLPLLLAFLVVCGVGVANCSTEEQMRLLLDSKLNATDYSSRVRPIKDTGNVLSVVVNMYMIGINDISEVEQKITTTAYMTITWSDTFLTWTPADHGGITKISIPQNLLWKPDLALANAFDTITGLGDTFIYLEITYEGVITWQPYQVFDSTCSLDMTYFPFDTQTCDLQLVTWSSTKEMISITAGTDGFSLAHYEKNANWDLLEATTFDSSSTSTAGLSFRLKLKRKPLYYLINFLIPIILLSALNVIVFVLPCDSGEKTSYAIILFLSFAIFLLIVTDIMPEGMNTIPVMSIYLLMECVLSTLIVFITIIQLRFHNQGDETPVPIFLQSFVGFISMVRIKLLCLGSEKKGNDDSFDFSNTDIKMAVMSDSSEETSEKKKMNGAMKGRNSADRASDFVKGLISGSNPKVRDIFYGRKVSPIHMFNQPTVTNTPYSHNTEVQVLEYDLLGTNANTPSKNVSATSKNREQRKNDYANVHPNRIANSAFTVTRKQNLVDSDDGSSVDDESNVATWSDVSGAIDSLCFVLFCVLNTIAALIAMLIIVVG